MMSLRDELLAIDGVLDAEVDDALSPGGVKVRLESGADASSVGSRVQEVLATHGLRSRVGPRRVEPATPPPPPGAPAQVVSLPARDDDMAGPITVEPVAEAGLDTVSVAEHAAGRTVSVRAQDGRVASREAAPGTEGIDAAVIAAVADLVASRQAPPRVVAVREIDVEGTGILVVVLASVRGAVAGAAVVDGSRARAIALAAWSALG